MDNQQSDHDYTEIPVNERPAEQAPDNEDENVYLTGQKDNIDHNGQDKDGILNIIYGILFEPGRTFSRFPHNPPIFAAVIIFLTLNLAETFTGFFTAPVYLDRISGLTGLAGSEANQAVLMLMALGGFSFAFIKWFFMAGLSHLLAELYGGNGTAKSVWLVYGVAGLPALFMIPVQIGAGLLNAGGLSDFIVGLLTFGLYVWCVVLLIIGLREVHQITTGRAVLVIITPGLLLLLWLLVTLIYIGTAVSSLLQVF